MASLFLNPLYVLTFIGEPLLWIVLSALFVGVYFIIRFYWYRYRLPMKRFLMVMIPSLAIVLALAFFLKAEFPIARPCTPCTMIQEACNPYCPANDPSFPSGHAAVAFTVFTSLWLVQRKGWQLPIFILPVAIAASRIALGVHTWLDVTIGSLLGFVVTLLVWRELEKRVFKTSQA